MTQASQQIVTVSGQVLAASGRPSGGAAVTIEGNGGRRAVMTDGAGAFRVDLVPGEYTINVNKGGYQTGSTDVVVTPGNSISIAVTLTESTLNNLTVIGRTSTNANRSAATFNISSSAATQTNVAIVRERNTPDLSQIVSELPGVSVSRSATNVNNSFIVRGLQDETKITLDGHPISSGVGGSFIANYAGAPIFGSIDVLKGAGLNGPTAGTSGNGTVNIRTPDFAPTNSGFLQVGSDSYAGTLFTAIANVNFLKNNRLSFIFGKSFSGYDGPTKGYYANDIDTAPSEVGFIPNTYNYTTPPLGNFPIASQSDFSNTYNLNAQLAKMRYKFSDATSLTLEFLGLQGRFDPQGGSYGQFAGYATVPQCINAKVAASGAACTVLSVYNAPSAQNLIGNTNVPLYQFYPGSDVRQNQPNFNADFKTTFKNDTIFFRPYSAVINRLIDGSGENTVPGNNGAWYQVTSNANCTVAFSAPSIANGGAKGPCYPANSPVGTPAYVVDPTTPHAYGAQSATPYNCSIANPCYTSSVKQANSGVYGFGTPYTTAEVDKLFGYTFTYIHPVGNNIFNLSFDHYIDDTRSALNDTSPAIAGCSFTQGGGKNPAPGLIGNQPNCVLNSTDGTSATSILPVAPIGTPETLTSISGLSLTAQLQLRPNLEFDFGNYFTNYKINAQIEDPNLVAQFAAAGVNTSVAPIAFVGRQNSASHYDPHFGFVFRPHRNVSMRLTGGSSIVVPYASQISGITTINQGASSTTLSQKNINLKPEEIVTQDLGGDVRLASGGIFSVDAFNTVVHNPWISTSTLIPNLPQIQNTPFTLLSTLQNGPEKHSQGLEMSLTNEPVIGFGYRLTTTLQRAYYQNLPAYFFSSPQATYNGKQIDGIPYSKGYAEIRYAGVKNSLVRLGMEYDGPNNANNYPAFVLFDAGVRFNVGNGISFQTTAENLTNQNFGNNLARAVEYQGGVPIAASIKNNQFVFGPRQPQFGIVGPPFRTFRFTLSKNL
ncbi:MAG: hypothetical protein NVSMB5_01360 [Candidatus Velthaea sp.]